MGSSKICMNASCGKTNTHEWKRGWPLRSGGYANLCFTCGSAYENQVYCDKFHLEESGWRECYICDKRLHCGCIVSNSLLELLDYGSVGCISCANSSQLQSNDGIRNGFGPLRLNDSGNLEATIANKVATNRVDKGKLAKLCRLMEVAESNLLCQSTETDTNAYLGQDRQEFPHPIKEVKMGFLNAIQSPIGSCKFVKPNNIGSMLDMSNVPGSLAQSSLSMTLGLPSSGNANFIAFPSGVVEARELGKLPSSFRQVQRSHTILPKPAVTNSETKKAVLEPRIARPPGDGQAKGQLLPRYWPRITDQELQQLSGDLNSNIVPLFEKVLSASDASRIGRLVLPKACAEAYFPPISQSEGLPLRIQDVKGREWTFQFRFWPNNNSRMYVLEGVTPCIQSMQLQAGDTITFSRIDPGGKLVIGFRKATNNSLDTEDAYMSPLPNGVASEKTSFSGTVETLLTGENNGGRVYRDSIHQSVASIERKRARNIGTKSKKLLVQRDDALDMRLTWEEAGALLRPPPSVKPSIVTVEDHEFEEYDEPPVFGKRTIFAASPSGEGFMGQEQWAQCDDCSKWRKLPVDALLPPKWTCSENVWDSNRRECSAPEELSPKDLDNRLGMRKDLKKRRIAESHKAPEECEPSGLDALASVAVLGDDFDDDPGEPSVEGATTTKHPRHRPGCTCIVCIQPPSGKSKHKPACICNVCTAVKRRFKTFMLRKQKRQSERDAGISQNGNNNDESEMNDTLGRDGVLCTDGLENGRNQSNKQTEVAETSTGQIDLNCHPSREDMQVDILRMSMRTMAGAGNLPVTNEQNAFANLTSEQHASLSSGMVSRANGESLRQLSDEVFISSF